MNYFCRTCTHTWQALELPSNRVWCPACCSTNITTLEEEIPVKDTGARWLNDLRVDSHE